MNEAHNTSSGFITYFLGLIAAFLSTATLNDWLLFLSIILVVLRIAYETYEFLQRRADRKAADRKNIDEVN